MLVASAQRIKIRHYFTRWSRWWSRVTRGDPESPLRWTTKSCRKLAEELCEQGHVVSAALVHGLLGQLGYSLQSNRKMLEGADHPDRDAQLQYINARVEEFQDHGLPAISVDAKKKELIGNFANAGCEWRPEGDPILVQSHDFIDRELGKAIPSLGARVGARDAGVSGDCVGARVCAVGR